MKPPSLGMNKGANKPLLFEWELVIKRKINFLALISIINLAIGLFYFLFANVQIINTELIFALVSLPFVFVVNKYVNYIWATYWFYLTDFVFSTFLTLKLGIDSYIIISFFPMIISMMHLLGRKETINHLIILSGACLLSIISIVLGMKFGNFTVHIDPEIKFNLASMIILLCFSTTIILTIMMIKQYIQQEENTRRALYEKEILLAEVYHRVKNNLNIVTSLLNLKKTALTHPR